MEETFGRAKEGLRSLARKPPLGGRGPRGGGGVEGVHHLVVPAGHLLEEGRHTYDEQIVLGVLLEHDLEVAVRKGAVAVTF